MQQRGINTSMGMESEERQIPPPQPRGRTNSKLKVLGRSHAMREEASPPRDPPNTSSSPYISLIRSPTSSPNQSSSPSISKPIVVLSPSISSGNSPCHSPVYMSPTSTLVPSPISRNSPQNVFENIHGTKCNQLETSDSSCSNLPNCCGFQHYGSNSIKQNMQEKSHNCEGQSRPLEETSQTQNSNSRKFLKIDKNICDCTNQACTNCFKNYERNINNNISNNNNNVVASSNTLMVSRSTRGKLRQQSSSQGSFEGSSSNSPCLSRDSSSEQYTDTTGVDLEQFIAETLNRNAKDRALMLRIEQELVNLAKDKIKSHYKFPPMSSYQRMLVHRCAAYFGMDHNIESSGKCVVVNKTKSTRIPDIEFQEYVKRDIIFMEEPRRSILKRDCNSIEEYSYKSPDRQFSFENRRSKSFEEREEEYERARKRIFNREMREFGSVEDFGWTDISWYNSDHDCSSRFRLLHPEKSGPRLLKVQSVETGTTTDTPRPCVAKSYSFGGYGGISVLTRGDSVMSTHSAGPRLLTKQDSGASTVSWRLSPSSSGYKSQSQISESVTPSPTSTPNPLGDSTNLDLNNSNISPTTSEHPVACVTEKDLSDPQLVWAVTDIHNVPKGSIIINPQTGQPVKNVDGSIYHYDPLNPPLGFNITTNNTIKPPPSPVKTSLPQKVKENISPKHQRSRSSPLLNKKSHLTNSSTSPSLPFTPPLQHCRSMQFTSSADSVSNVSLQQYHPVYGNSFNNMQTPDNSMQVYQQPYIVYASYGIPLPSSHFEGRMEHPQMPEVPGGYFMTDSSGGTTTPQPVPYQTGSSYWNQQPVTVFHNPLPNIPPPPPHRYTTVHVPTQPGSFISSAYCQQPPAAPPPPPPPPPPTQPQPPQQSIQPNSQNPELVQLYSHQPVQVVYPTQQQNQTNTVMYPNHSFVYSQGPVYSNMMLPIQNITQNLPYPQNPSTPSGGSTPILNSYGTQLQDQITSSSLNYSQLTQSMNHLSISSNQIGTNQINSNPNVQFSQNMSMPHTGLPLDMRNMKNFTTKGNKFSTPRNILSSSQSSTGTNSPAATVISGYCSAQNTAPSYRTPPETPPTQNFAYSYGPNFVSPMAFRQMNSIQPSQPANRNSRSPTPGSDSSYLDRHRFSLPPTLFQGLPYVLQNDSRILSNRGQPLPFRQPLSRQHSLGSQNGENTNNKLFRNRKSR